MVEESTAEQQTADEQLVHIIVNDMLASKIISEEQGTKICTLILGNKASKEEWRALFEFARPGAEAGSAS